MNDREITTNESTGTSRERRIATAAAALARHADPGPTALGSLTDEQLVVLHGTSKAPALLTPWLDRSTATDAQRELLLSSAARGQLAAGAIAPEGTLAKVEGREPVGDPEDLLPTALPAGIVGRRVYSSRRVTATDLDDPARGAIQAFADLDGTVMQEQISANGIHHFTMSSVDSAARVQVLWLLGAPDPESAPTEEQAAEVRSGTLEELTADPEIGVLLSSATRRVRILAEDRAEGVEQVLWVLHDGESTVALQPSEHGTGAPSLEASVLEVVRVGPDGLRAQLAEFMTSG
ncbi:MULTISPECIES: hypothetical protein [unclassified Brachybacterium]|uniref:hypothetical protein n=1 Tax=unclassified Brachybacterium TaxID=2623841 RepID=UPI0040340DD9